MTESAPAKEPSIPPMTLALGLLLGLGCAVLPLVPEPYRAYNFAAFGAVGLFVAGRMGLIPGLILALGSKLLSDVLNYAAHDYHDDYLPLASIVASLAIYPIIGFALVRRTQNPFRIAGGAVLASALFFLFSNFASWLNQAMPYPYTVAGLLDCYRQGIPFYRGTFLGDLICTGSLFAVHAALARYYFPAERSATVTVENNR